MTATETVDLYVIARLDDGTAVADLYGWGIYYDADAGAEAGPSVEVLGRSLVPHPDLPATLEALDHTLVDFGYHRTTDWRRRVTTAGAVRFFTHAIAHIDDIDR